MKISVRFLLFAGIFGLVIGVAYAFATRAQSGQVEAAGTVLLLIMGLAPIVIAGYLHLHRRGLSFPEDEREIPHESTAGDEIGKFSTGSLWPLVMAIGLAFGVLGFIYGTWMLAFGIIMFVWATIGLMQESHG